jgi:hypothetical protein
MKQKTILLTLLLILLCVQGVQAMESSNFSLDWFTPLNSGGGGPTSSTHYAANFTIGQTSIGRASSDNYHAGLGYWYGITKELGAIFQIHLPVITK